MDLKFNLKFIIRNNYSLCNLKSPFKAQINLVQFRQYFINYILELKVIIIINGEKRKESKDHRAR